VTGPPSAPERLADLEAVYREYHAFVWRTLHHFGLRGEAVDDGLQEVFVIVHRRLVAFDGRTAIKNWLYGIARRVASDHRKKLQRKQARLQLVASSEGEPHEPRQLERLTTTELVEHLLASLDEDKREVFVMAEVEGMTAPEIASALGVNLNTVYSRLRAARAHFHREAVRYRAREDRRRAWQR
jgi:RNA polymerase sigma-70 factor (ECF subfamily)